MKPIKIFLGCLMIFLLVGCDRFLSGDKEVYVDYKSGTKGLSIELVENMPPKTIYEKENFLVGVKLKNDGAYDIGKGEIFVAGFDDYYNKLEKKDAVLRPLRGRSMVFPEGESYIEEFKGRNLILPAASKEYRAKYIIYADYDYETVLDLDVCVNPSIYDLKLSKDTCKVASSVSLSGQGAPVAISKVEEVVSPEGNNMKVQFRLHIVNKGDGKLISPVRIMEVKLANRRLSCSASTVDLKDSKEEKVVLCEGIEPLQSAYTTKLSGHLSYTYEIKKTNDFVIKKLQFN